MSPRIRNIGIIAILVALLIAGSMVGLAWAFDNSHAQAPSTVTEVPSSIVVSESGLPTGYNWTFYTITRTLNGTLTRTYTGPTGQSISIPYSPGLRVISANWFGPYVPHGNGNMYIGNYIPLPVNGFAFDSSNVINSSYTFYYYKAVNVTFTVSGVPSDVLWDINTAEVVGSIFGPQLITSSNNLNGYRTFSVAALPGGNLSFSVFVNPTSGYVANLPSGHVNVSQEGAFVSVHLYKRTYWYTLPAYWFNEGKSLAINYWWAILLILIGGFVGYIFEIGLPSREEIKRDLRRAEKKVKK